MDLNWKAYELRPGLPSEGIPRIPKDGEVDGFQPHFTERAVEFDLKLKRSPIVPCSRPALEVAEYAKEQGKFDVYHRAVFKVYWEEGKNIGLRKVLLKISEVSGLDTAEVERVLEEGKYTQSVIDQSENAKECGAGGIPAYVIGGFLIEGVQPYQFFQRAIDVVMDKKRNHVKPRE